MTDRPKRRLLDDTEFHEMVIRIDERTGYTSKTVKNIEEELVVHRDKIATNDKKISNLRSWFNGAVAILGIVGVGITLYQVFR